MTPMFEIDAYGNQYVSGYEYRLLWGKLILEYEFAHSSGAIRPWLPCILKQWGGDHIYQWNFGWFRRSVGIRIWEFN